MAHVAPGRAREIEMDRLDALSRRRQLTDREADRLAELVYLTQRRGCRVRYALQSNAA